MRANIDMDLTVESMVPQDPAVDVGTYMFSFPVSRFQICCPGVRKKGPHSRRTFDGAVRELQVLFRRATMSV